MFVGNDDSGRPKQVSRTVRGTERDAQRAAAELTVAPPAAADERTVAVALEAWIETHATTWAASTVRDQTGRASLVKADKIARVQLARLTVADVERWHTRQRAVGVGESSLRNQHLVPRASLAQAARWGWVTTNVAALATLARRTAKPRAAMTAADVRAVIDSGERLDPAAGLAFRLGAITGARRAELCALVYRDLDGDRLTIDSSIAIGRTGSVSDRQVPALLDAATKTGNQRVVRLDQRTVAAIEAIGRGHDIRTVAGRLGHANPAMTLRTYAHALDGADAGVAATLASALEEP